jgi:hypothetical protein
MFLYMSAVIAAPTMCSAATTIVTSAGATGNGTTDDTAAIQSALNSSAAGDTIVFPAGTYRISSAITVPSYRTLQGQPGAILKGAIGTQLVQLEYNDLKIDGFTFDGGGIVAPGNDSTKPPLNVTITNNKFQNIATSGTNYNSVGILAPNGFSGQISGNTFVNIYAGGVVGWSEVNGAIWLWNPSNTLIANNTFDQIGQAIHVTVTAPYATPPSNVTISTNTITRNARYNIEIQGTAMNNLIVTANNISQFQPGINGQTAISVAVGGTGHQITNNILQGPNAGNPSNQSLAIESEGSGFLIQGNVAGHFGVAQSVLWTDATWQTENNTWCDMNYFPSPQNVLFLDTNGHNPAVNTGNVLTTSCTGVVFPIVTSSSAAPPPAPPVLSLAAPSPNSFVTGKIPVSATVTSTTPLTSVSFILDGSQTIGQDFASPYSTTWDTSLVADGAHTLKAVGVDSNGNTGTSAIINVTTQNAGAAAPAVPSQGLQLWLRGDAGITAVNGNVASWADQSPNRINATQSVVSLQPAIAKSGHVSVVRFNGSPKSLNFPLAINGWTGMTILMVAANSANVTGGSSPNAAIFWDETVWWGTTYLSPYQTNVSFRFGTTQTYNWPDYQRPASVGTNLNLTETVHSGTTDYLYVNGNLAYSQGGKFSAIEGAVNVGALGVGSGNTPFAGDIAEVLVYNRALTNAERQGIETYLMNKYSLR